MKKYFSLIKATFSSDMNIFRINNSKYGAKVKKILPIVLLLLVLYSFTYYTMLLTKQFHKVNLEYLVLSLFAFLTFFLTIIEGIYKSGDLLFNCKDDDLLLALPIKKSIILFVRVFKFYVFELMYNSLFFIPAIIAYAYYVHPDYLFYIISLIMIFLLPIIPVLISIIIGFMTKQLISHFKYKNLAQIIFASGLLLGILYFYMNAKELINKLIINASSIFDIIKKVYYPAYLYYELFTDFKLDKLLIYLGINIILVIIMINILSMFYFKINSRTKEVSNLSVTKHYKIKAHSQLTSFVIKELKKMVTTPVFIINACFGLILFIVSAILLSVKSASFIKMINNYGFNLGINSIFKYIPLVLIGLIAMAALTSSITSSMVSLEGKSFNILKSLPISSKKIIMAKVLTALLVMVPVIFIGDIIIYSYFSFNVISIVLTVIASIILPLISALLGITFNSMYPNMTAANDTEIVKQSTSVLVSLFANFGVIIIIGLLIYLGIKNHYQIDMILLIIDLVSAGILLVAIILLNTIGIKSFNKITV